MCSEKHQKHLLIIEDDRGSRQLLLDKPLYSIGRDRECDIRLASFFVSRHHALLVQVPASEGECCYRIVDGDVHGQRSANGLLVNGHILKSHDLRNEDKVVFGPQAQFTYYRLHREPTTIAFATEIDDITLINPKTAEEFSDAGFLASLPPLPFQSSQSRLLVKIRRQKQVYCRVRVHRAGATVYLCQAR
jgi:pSer/pThr/pTyr-binding forkhead associated (FHA) protein